MKRGFVLSTALEESSLKRKISSFPGRVPPLATNYLHPGG
ncbi:hypothetical protein D3OALGA1CA_2477 [Olavius algarvensis associated proteobacterium Delta 3]|nr:hypothetical protein D3OALGA1CA_2477 [Olavius algarvensis associated proteobacterium Delta 3]CAB5154789.1 hypothetical protein D3OALGB2SA_5031 [Olavius algarvensis associated proteobacterium Delta 3]